MKMYDLAVVGAGPAGSVAAMLASSAGMSVLVFEKGRSLKDRKDLACGWFGHGLYSMDRLDAYEDSFDDREAFSQAEDMFHIASGGRLEVRRSVPEMIGSMSMSGGMYFLTGMASGRTMAEDTYRKTRADMLFETKVDGIFASVNGFMIHSSRGRFNARKCLVSSGRMSYEWVSGIAGNLGVAWRDSSARMGVRIEIPSRMLAPLMRGRGDIGMECGGVLIDDARMNGFVGEWDDFGVASAFAHCLPDKRSSRASLAVSVEVESGEEAFRLARITNVLSGDKVKRERLQDVGGHRSSLRHFEKALDLVEASMRLSELSPRIMDTAVAHVPAIMIGGALTVDESMRTECPGFYGAGHCTSRVRTLIGAVASGVVAARSVLQDEEMK